jgi:hypothetical protein
MTPDDGELDAEVVAALEARGFESVRIWLTASELT